MLRRIFLQSSLLIGLACGAGYVTSKVHPDPPGLYLGEETVNFPYEITAAQARELEKEPGGVIWVDARQRSEFEKEHIPGAILLNQYEWEDRMMDFIQAVSEKQGRPVIIYCDAQKCKNSHELRHQIIDKLPVGDLDLRILHGGWPAWRDSRRQ